MNKKNKIKITIAIILIITLVLVSVIGFLYYKKLENEKEMNTPQAVLEYYIEQINNNNYAELYKLLSTESKTEISEEDLTKKYKEVYNELGVSNTQISDVQTQKIDINNSKITYKTNLQSIYGNINYLNTISLVKEADKKYYIDWDYNVIYPELQKEDKIVIKKNEAKRGSLIDRNGRLLAGSGYIASVGLVPGWMNEETKAQDIVTVATLLGTTPESINKKLSASYVKADTFVELDTISKQKQSTIYNLNQINGVKIKDIESRVYPFGAEAAHITGYVQKANSKDLEKNKLYDENTLIGRTGLENVYEDRLKGIDGYEINLVDNSKNIRASILKTEKVDGENIKLTIDSDIQSKVYSIYATDNSATVVMNPKTGEIIALVSTPSFDPNNFVIGMSSQEWNELNNNANNPMYTRFLRSYSPGSSFKAIMGAIALQTGTITGSTEYEKSGKSWQKDSTWGDYYITTLKEYNTSTNLLNALINSDNIFFAKTALKIGSSKLEEQLKSIGFEKDIKFEMGLNKSQISKEGKFVNEVQLADSGYGQGQILINPIHYASMYSAFVNEGNMVMPYLEIKENNEVTYLKENAFSKEVANEITQDLIQTIENPEGTAYSARIDGIKLAGKTGTAETKTNKGESAKEFGWFNAFIADANSDNQLLVISMVENVENKGGSLYVVEKVKNVFLEILNQ